MVQQNSASESTINKSENTRDPKKQVMIEYEFLEKMFDLTGKQITEYDPNSKEAKTIRECFAIIKTQVDQMNKIETPTPKPETSDEVDIDFLETIFNVVDMKVNDYSWNETEAGFRRTIFVLERRINKIQRKARELAQVYKREVLHR